MINLPSLLIADGLSPADKDTLEALISVHSRVMSRNRTLVRYYEAKAQPPLIGIDTIPETVNVAECTDWPKKAVTSVAERSRLSGFVFDGEDEPGLAQIVRDNALVGTYHRHVHSELIHGCVFATVGKRSNDPSSVYIRFHSAETSAALWDDGAGRLGAGLVLAATGLAPWSKHTPVPIQYNMHLPGRTIVFTATGLSQWQAIEAQTSMDRPAMEAFAYRPTDLQPFGESRISRAVMRLADDVVRTLQNMAVSAALYSSPQKYLLGLSEEQFDAFTENGASSAWTTYITRVLMAERDEDGNVPTFGQLTAASPEPYISVLRTYATLFSGMTGVPLNSLGIVQDNPSSAEAIEAAREDICICAQDLNESNGESLRNVALMAMACAEDCAIEELTDNQRSVMAKFLSPSMPSVVSQADAATKIASVAPWFAESDEFLRMLGFDEATIRQLAGARAMGNTQQLLAAFNNRPIQG